MLLYLATVGVEVLFYFMRCFFVVSTVSDIIAWLLLIVVTFLLPFFPNVFLGFFVYWHTEILMLNLMQLLVINPKRWESKKMKIMENQSFGLCDSTTYSFSNWSTIRPSWNWLVASLYHIPCEDMPIFSALLKVIKSYSLLQRSL